MIYVLDASAILRYLDDEAGALRVQSIIASHVALRDQVMLSAIQWGEVSSVLCKRGGREIALRGLSSLARLQFDIVPVTSDRAQRAAFIQVQKRIPYADAFAVELTSDAPDRVLVTADFDFKLAENDIHIEFLPPNTRET